MNINMNFATTLTSRLASRSFSSRMSERKAESASIASSQASCTSGSSSSEGSSLSRSLDSPCTSEPGELRPNEHLAVLLPKSFWKPDREACYCDIFMCRKKFGVWERKHHCRKCGGVVCGDCSARMTKLLDTTNLEFSYPPRHTPIDTFDSPTSPVLEYRVCDHCWDQIHGIRSPRSPITRASTPIALLQEALKGLDSPRSSASSSLPTPLDASPILRPSLHRARTASPRTPSSPLRSPVQSPHSLTNSVHVADSELKEDLGELEAYPLRHASAICKATGGGRWEPKQRINLIGYRLPGQKAQYEIDLEREEEERKRRKQNPVIIDGDFQLRVPCEIEPRSPAGPITLSTF
ncbi:hypothetical protein IEO21_02715 [Rhodonia placenta]|uniref:FYVE-type domain-containing protein n=1 Tax=Rhodonia placenta TaxID=104341 RepID=A0A8H7U432_9APHY|nr:hypothetical protein IEO21_02715 [Postia placenta]